MSRASRELLAELESDAKSVQAWTDLKLDERKIQQLAEAFSNSNINVKPAKARLLWSDIVPAIAAAGDTDHVLAMQVPKSGVPMGLIPVGTMRRMFTPDELMHLVCRAPCDAVVDEDVLVSLLNQYKFVPKGPVSSHAKNIVATLCWPAQTDKFCECKH